jgi:nucleoid DNA-binding protein
MQQRQLIRRLARKSKVSEAVAADSIDKVVHAIVSRLRRKQVAEVPGIAKLQPKRNGGIAVNPSNTGKEQGNAGS